MPKLPQSRRLSRHKSQIAITVRNSPYTSRAQSNAFFTNLFLSTLTAFRDPLLLPEHIIERVEILLHERALVLPMNLRAGVKFVLDVWHKAPSPSTSIQPHAIGMSGYDSFKAVFGHLKDVKIMRDSVLDFYSVETVKGMANKFAQKVTSIIDQAHPGKNLLVMDLTFGGTVSGGSRMLRHTNWSAHAVTSLFDITRRTFTVFDPHGTEYMTKERFRHIHTELYATLPGALAKRDWTFRSQVTFKTGAVQLRFNYWSPGSCQIASLIPLHVAIITRGDLLAVSRIVFSYLDGQSQSFDGRLATNYTIIVDRSKLEGFQKNLNRRNYFE